MTIAFSIRSGFRRFFTGRKLMAIMPVIVLLIAGNKALAQHDLQDRFKRIDDESELRPGETMEGKVKKNFFLKAEVNKTECFAGESIMATFKAYSRLNANSQVVKRPSLTGFSVLEMVDGYSNEPDIEKVNGKYFYVHLIRKVQLIPLQSGNFNLDGAEVESVIHFTRSARGEESAIKSLRDFLRGGSSRHSITQEELDYRVNLETPPIAVRVIPLPEPAKDIDFSGAVGQFTIEMEMPDKQIKQYEPAIVRLVVRGSGNFPLITEPSVPWPANAEVSAPDVTEEVNRYVFPLAGTKTFQYSLEAKNIGDYTIPPMHFSYFDPAEKAYRTIETKVLSYSVIPVKNDRNPPLAGNDTPELSTGLPRQLYWFGGVAVIIIGWIIFQLFRLKKDKRSPDSQAEELIAASAPKEDDTAIKRKDALDKNIALVKESLQEGDQRSFYNLVQLTVWEAIGDRYAISPTALSKRLTVQLMSKDLFPNPVVESTISLLNECELALYTPNQNQADMLNTYLLLESWIREIQLNYH